MMNFMILAAESISWSERFNYIGIGSLLGMGVVFAVLILLWLVLELFHLCFSKAGNGKKKKAEKASEAAPAPVPAPAPAPAPAVVEEVAPAATGDEGELIAAITAALAIYLEGEAAVASSASSSAPVSQFASGFRVVSFKKVGNAAHWNQN